MATQSPTPARPRAPKPSNTGQERIAPINNERISFIGGGNMASAIISGLIKQGMAPRLIDVVEPDEEARARLTAQFGVTTHTSSGPALDASTLLVWAIKPQVFKEAALQARYYTKSALHLSVAAGIHTDSIVRWLGTKQVVRAMPNTPAMVGKGITALYPRSDVAVEDRRRVESVISSTGEHLWVGDEVQLDAVTALSGSGPAYVFYFLETMIQAGSDMGLPREQAQHLAIATFAGAAELARKSDQPPEILRQRVTSKGGTTHAAIASMEQDQMRTLFMRAIHAARLRAKALGDEFGAS
ncbi:MAG: pyrroline-5-carboxylate reductase [Burkholderiales bacterium]